MKSNLCAYHAWKVHQGWKKKTYHCAPCVHVVHVLVRVRAKVGDGGDSGERPALLQADPAVGAGVLEGRLVGVGDGGHALVEGRHLGGEDLELVFHFRFLEWEDNLGI